MTLTAVMQIANEVTNSKLVIEIEATIQPIELEPTPTPLSFATIPPTERPMMYQRYQYGCLDWEALMNPPCYQSCDQYYGCTVERAIR